MSNSETHNNMPETDSEYPALEEDMKAELAEKQTPSETPERRLHSKDTEEFDYIIPDMRKKKKHKKKRISAAESSPTDEEMDDFVFASPKKRKHKKHRKKWPLWLKILVIVVSVILALVIAVTATYFIMKDIGRKALHNYDDIDITIPLQDESGKDAANVMDKGRTIKYGGKTYRLNEDIMAVTFIGYNEGQVGESDNYMADAIYIAAIDDHTGKTTILGISRDTMLDVDVYSADGKFIDTETTQLSYAYSYSSEKVKGGANVNTSLSRLFFGLPLNSYFAIDLNSLEDFNEAVGGVTLTSKMEFVSKETGETVHVGDTVTLRGSDVRTYVQSRDLEKLDSNNDRMDRQQQYITALLSSIVPAAKKDLGTVTRLFGVVNDKADTTIDLPQVTYLASAVLTKLKSAGEIEFVRLSGKIKAGEHAEMYLSDKDVLETMLKVFYTPVE